MFEKWIKEQEARLKQWVEQALDILDKSVEEKSPVDTGEYIRGNRRENAKLEGTKVVGWVYNDSPNAQEVEFGFRRTPVNRHKNRRQGWPVIYRGVGARVMTRSADENDQQIRNILSDKIKWW